MKINIVLAADEKYSKYCMITLSSILYNTTSFIEVYILTSGFSETTKQHFQEFENLYNCNIHFTIVDNSALEGVPLPKELSHINIVTYYRLLMSKVLPNDIDKVVYLDCDIIVRHDIADLASIPIENYAIGAVLESSYENRKNDMARLSIPLDYGYFNAGVLLINLSYWRAHRLDNVFMSYLYDNAKNIIYHDQDVLNATLYDKALSISVTWNMIPCLYLRGKLPSSTIKSMHEILYDPSLVHFVYVPKPWQSDCENPWKKEYYNYCCKAGFPELKPVNTTLFKVKTIVKNILGRFLNIGYLSL